MWNANMTSIGSTDVLVYRPSDRRAKMCLLQLLDAVGRQQRWDRETDIQMDEHHTVPLLLSANVTMEVERV